MPRRSGARRAAPYEATNSPRASKSLARRGGRDGADSAGRRRRNRSGAPRRSGGARRRPRMRCSRREAGAGRGREPRAAPPRKKSAARATPCARREAELGRIDAEIAGLATFSAPAPPATCSRRCSTGRVDAGLRDGARCGPWRRPDRAADASAPVHWRVVDAGRRCPALPAGRRAALELRHGARRRWRAACRRSASWPMRHAPRFAACLAQGPAAGEPRRVRSGAGTDSP